MSVYLSTQPDADELLAASPLALLVGMLLDQQIPLEVAFAGPKKLLDRLGSLDAHDIATMDPDEFAAICATPPAVHRFPGSMAKRIQALCAIVDTDYDGDAAAVWTSGDPDGAEVCKRLKALPGFGEQKAKIFLALLGKQFGLAAAGWREAAGQYGADGTHLSVADIRDPDSLQQVRAHKKQMKAAAKAAKAG